MILFYLFFSFFRKWGIAKWPFSDKKSYVGSFTFFVSAFLSSCLLLQWLVYTGCLTGFSVAGSLLPLLFISFVCTLVELLPFVDDNITVPVVAAILAKLLLVN